MWNPFKPKESPPEQPKWTGAGVRKALAKIPSAGSTKSYDYPIANVALPPGVVPNGVQPAVAMDSAQLNYVQASFPGGGFPGYPYLSQLATRAEYRAFADCLSTELTREWIEFTSSDTEEGDAHAVKIEQIEAEFKRLGIRNAIQIGAAHDAFFGRCQIFVDVDRADRTTPLVLDPRTVPKGSLKRVCAVEAMWTTPNAYDAIDPASPSFYKPASWFMLGQEVHSSRLMTIVTRPLPDMLKPAFNFGGMSLSQLAEPYVDNWLRTRQSVADLINNFSITVLATDMGQILQDGGDGASVVDRVRLFNATRSNLGTMLLDKEREEIVQVNTPLSGLHELQAQSQEHMCSVSRMPAIVLTGISPSGLNASSDGEIRIFYDWISAQQESHWREPLEVILKLVQLSLFGEIDPTIGFTFVPLYQMTPKEEAEIRQADSVTDTNYINGGVLDPSEVRERLATDPNSGYGSLDTDMVIVPPTETTGEEAAAMDSAAGLLAFLEEYKRDNALA